MEFCGGREAIGLPVVDVDIAYVPLENPLTGQQRHVNGGVESGEVWGRASPCSRRDEEGGLMRGRRQDDRYREFCASYTIHIQNRPAKHTMNNYNDD